MTTATPDRRAAAVALLELERRISKLTLLAAELRSLSNGDGIIAARMCDKARRLLVYNRGPLYEALGVEAGSTARDVRRLADELAAEVRADYARSQ